MIKVWFFLPRDGWHQYEHEGMWARRVGEDTAVVENSPFLAGGVAEGDVVRFRTDSDGRHWAVERLSSSGNCTIRVIAVPTGPLGRSPEAVHQRLPGFKLGGEVYSEDFPHGGVHRPRRRRLRWDQGAFGARDGVGMVALGGRLRNR